MIVQQWGSQMTMLQDAHPLLYVVIMAVTMNPNSEVIMVTGQNSALLVDNRRFIML